MRITYVQPGNRWPGIERSVEFRLNDGGEANFVSYHSTYIRRRPIFVEQWFGDIRTTEIKQRRWRYGR